MYTILMQLKQILIQIQQQMEQDEIQLQKQELNLQSQPKQHQLQNQAQNNELTTCQMYLVRKKRMCKFPVVLGSKYCSAHCSDLEDKVQCPYEKGFFVSAKKLEKHLKNCPKVLNKKKEQNSHWYSKDVNKAQEKNQPQHKLQMPNLSLISDDTMDKMVKKVLEMYQNHMEKQQLLHFIESTPCQKIEETTNDHLQARLITQKAFQNKLVAPEFIYVQFGAGKGVLSYAIAVKIEEEFKTHSKNILLERQARRNKFDKFFRDNPYFQRYKGDVADFDFKMLPTTMAHTAVEKCRLKTDPETIEQQIGKLELIGICKHMCGQALDISMRGLLQGNAKGCILASCCHHLCRYHTYLNPQFFEREGLTAQEIQILFRMSSWGTKSHRFDELRQSVFDEMRQKGYGLMSAQQKILVGRMCKRLIDLGRAQFLNGKLYRYCSDQLTPENYVIISRN